MNHILDKVLDDYTPKFNKNVTDGTSKQIMECIPEYLDSIFRSSIKSLSSKAGLTYEGYRKLTPIEEFNAISIAEGSRVKIDLARSDLRVIEFVFNFKGEEIRRPVLIPFSGDGNLMYISNTAYSITPVLSDTVISPSPTEIFVRLLKDKLTFKGSFKSFNLNGEKINANVIYTNIIKTQKMSIKDEIGKPLIAIGLYLVGEYGIKEAFKRYLGTTDIVVTGGDTKHLEEKYNIFSSVGIKPKYLKASIYNPPTIKICVSKEVPLSMLLINFVCGLIYSFELLPETENDLFDILNNNRSLDDEIYFWRILLGRITYKNYYSIQRISEDIKDHFETLQGYLDDLIKTKLSEHKIKANNFFDVLAIILENFNSWLLNSKSYNSDINNRYIDILYYLLYDIIVGFNKVILALNKRCIKKNAVLSTKEVSKVLGDCFGMRKIFGIVKSSAQSLAIMLVENTTDVKYYKITALLEDQSRGNGVRKGKTNKFPLSTRSIKGHDLYLGSLLFLTKSAPSPRFRSNPFLNYDINSGKLIIPDNIEKTIKKLDSLLTGRIVNNKIEIMDLEEDVGE